VVGSDILRILLEECPEFYRGCCLGLQRKVTNDDVICPVCTTTRDLGAFVKENLELVDWHMPGAL